ncbi:MAG: hypothetical protein QG641_1746 [Candidatus Poribacteria bacterium]|nr:hypothetical protein [Candidatus Poribacteria bacterium]
MKPDDLIRLKHILDAARETLSLSSGYKRVDLDTNRMLTLALIKDIEIIGEAAVNISKETKYELDQIDWQRIIGMRNRLVHVYFKIDLNILWNTIQYDIPELINELEKLLES